MMTAMSDLQCKRSGCFYLAKGRCTNITALEADNCAQFLDKQRATRVAPSRRLDLSMARWHIDQAYRARANDEQTGLPCARAS